MQKQNVKDNSEPLKIICHLTDQQHIFYTHTLTEIHFQTDLLMAQNLSSPNVNDNNSYTVHCRQKKKYCMIFAYTY